MIAVVLRGLLGRKLRAALTAIAIVLGVAMISGTYVLMDTTMRAFDQVFETAYSKTDASVSGKTPFSAMEAVPPPVSANLLAPIRGLPEVQAAEGFIEDSAQLRTARGEALRGPGFPLALGITTGSGFNPLEMIAGREPTGAGEIALDEDTATRNDLRIGSRVGVAARGPLEWFRVVGLFRFGGVESLGPVQMMVFDLPEAQRLFEKQGLYDVIDVRAREGVTGAELAEAITPLLPSTAEVKTRAERVDASSAAVGEGMAIVRYVLLAFGGVALFVGSFVIFNTLSITVAQRMRELATLRTIGASRGQVLGSVMLEGALIGALASLLRLAGGFALAGDTTSALFWLREAVRFDAAHADAHLVMSTVLMRAGKTVEARRELDLARLIGTTVDPAALTLAATIPPDLERTALTVDAAPIAYVTAAIANPAQRDHDATATFHLERGRRLVEAQNDREGVNELRRAIYLAPYADEPHLLLGKVYQRTGRLEDAINEYKIAIWARETAAARVALGTALLEAGDRIAARAEAERALKLAPESAEARALLARIGGGSPRI